MQKTLKLKLTIFNQTTRRGASCNLGKSHDIFVGISAHQILERLDGCEYMQTPYEGDRLSIIN